MGTEARDRTAGARPGMTGRWRRGLRLFAVSAEEPRARGVGARAERPSRRRIEARRDVGGRDHPDRVVRSPAPTRHRDGVLLLALLVFGLVVGWVAQMLLGLGSRPDGRTLVAGIVGSFVGGLLASLVAGDGLALRPSGLIGSLVGALIVLLVWTRLAPTPTPGRGGRR